MSLETLRDIAVVIIALEVFVMLVAPTVMLFLAVKGLGWVMRKLKYYAPMVQMRFRQVADTADRFSGKVAEPVIASSAYAARVRRVRQTAFSFVSKEEV